MIINLSPIRSDVPLFVVRAGDTLSVNGQDFDFSPLPVGADIPADAMDSPWFAGPVSRGTEGVLHLTLLLPHGKDPSPAVAFPEPLVVTEDGLVELPT